MENKERKCIACGEVLGEREAYCGNCGTKAPDGAACKEETDPKYIIAEKEYEPWMDFSWKAQNFFCKQKKGWFSGPGGKSEFYYFLFRYDIYIMSIIVFIIHYYFIERNLFGILDVIQLCIHILFLILFTHISGTIYDICDKLMSFTKKAPKALYTHCILRIFACPMYAICLMLMGFVHPSISWIALIEGIAGLAALIISTKYYEKRKDAFIN